ncbi:uncharacterized protein LOC134546353 isoform X2 [Bacillus rossius redtenbacheri]|uniref:uncharacterized protein LOC134546353 isoform X2 n=1 Tax=Bacillus rossius redtenbacheri TaxID=93214 RepID=UPI002FDD7DBC
MSKIESFIILDFETTGIEREARITEIAFIAVSREHILCAATKAKGLPRVMNKFTICLNPDKPINPIAAKISGLNNDLLQGQKPFDSTAFNILENFVCRLPQPVCLIAHNGDSYDFPILQAELEAFKQLPEHILCADSIKCFRALLGPNRQFIDSKTIVQQNESVSVNLTAQVMITRLKNCKDVNGSTQVLNVTNVNSTQQVGAMTVMYSPAKRRRTAMTLSTSDGKHGCLENEIIRDVSNRKRTPNSFKLVDIYRYFFNRKSQDNHTAHGDAQNLLECIIATGSDFLCWADKNARKLSDVKSRWSQSLS